MKILAKVKDGGPESKVTAYFLIEWKRFFSIALLRFDKGSREAFHTHAFNCISWVLKGCLFELEISGHEHWHEPSLKPVLTYRHTFHQVHGMAPSTWVLTFRGPWVSTWYEWVKGKTIKLTNGRREVPLG